MADSFADLWNSSAPAKPTVQKLGSVPTTQPRKPQHDVFSMLSSAGSSAPSSRPITPSSTQANSKPKPAIAKQPSTGDPFSGLLSGSLAASNNANLTIAQRAALAEQQRTDEYLKKQETVRKQAAAWDGLDSLDGLAAVVPSQSNRQDNDDCGLGISGSLSTEPAKADSQLIPIEEDDWGIGMSGSSLTEPANANSISRDAPSASVSSSQAQDRNVQIQDQADKLIAQASEIGISVFNRANAFWKEGKERAQRLIEETVIVAGSGPGVGGQGRGDGRPRWMDAPVAPYVSPSRRGTGRPKPDRTPKPIPVRAPSPIKLTKRLAIAASPTAIATSTVHKSTGTEKYKLGQFNEAESAFSNAISSLPTQHLLLIPLYNNRALARLKTGNQSGAVEDCTAVIELVGVGYHPAREEKVVEERLCGPTGVDLGEGLVKALKRRAEAWEGKEKWEEARRDWEALAGIGWAAAAVRSEAIRGAGRCKRMVCAGAGVEEQPKPKPKLAAAAVPKRPSPQHIPAPPSLALAKLHDARTAQEAEDQQRLELKDTVDSRLNTWKGGKEKNIRALISSLETVLWPELGWQKVGMAEVVTPSQVKIRYTKAIAKLHPDKVGQFVLVGFVYDGHVPQID